MGEAGPVEVGADITPCEEAVADCQKQIDGAEEERQKTMVVTSTSMRHVARAMIGVVGITTSIFEAIGITLDPVGQALIGLITSTISALSSMSVALAAGGITAAMATVTAAAAIYLATVTLAGAVSGIDTSKSELRQAQNLLRMLHSSVTLFRAGGW
jgi:hypothetical protein